MDIFVHTDRPEAGLFYHRDDPNDVRLGETATADPSAYTAARFVLLGLPQDEGVRRNKGRPGAAAAPDAVRRCLYRLVTLGQGALFDLGNTLIEGSLEAIHDRHRAIVRQILRDGKTLIVLGGGNDTSYPDCSALAQEHSGQVTAINIDAHFDVRADQPRNSGTPYRQLLEEGFIQPEHFYEVGYQPFGNSSAYLHYVASKGCHVVTAEALEASSLVDEIFSPAAQRAAPDRKIFLGLDMDVIRASDAPGVSAPNPLGLSAQRVRSLICAAGADPRVRLFEITEVNPQVDIDERTCRLAAAFIWHFMAARAALSE